MDIIKDVRNVFLSGIGGIGVSALARYFLHNGTNVFGSDIKSSDITRLLESLGADIKYEQRLENISEKYDLFVYSPAISIDHVERVQANILGINSLSYPQCLAKITKTKSKTVAISGTHGKTTTTAMFGLVMECLSLDPTVIVGSFVSAWSSNFRAGGGEYLVLEACEHQAHMTLLHTHDCVITNIEEDHLDYYGSLDKIVEAFQLFIDRNNKQGFIFLNHDDPASQKLSIHNLNTVTFGFQEGADFRAVEVSFVNGKCFFSVVSDNVVIGSYELKLPGRHNVLNALSVIAYTYKYGFDQIIVREALKNFSGTWRRFDRLGKYGDSIIISDYAHHPTAIRATIEATREFYQNKKILCVFQPHQHNRTKTLFEEFVEALIGCAPVIVTEIFDVAGREDVFDADVSSSMLVDRLKAVGVESYYAGDFNATKKILDQYIKENGVDVILIMGAGDIHEFALSLIEKR